MYKLSNLDKISFVLVIIGAVNWGLIGLFSFNFVNFLFGIIPLIEKIIYVIIGIAGANIILLVSKSNIRTKDSH
ncbi:DUF378 domain-containing protein [Clostridium sp. DL1XJH146]